MGNKHTKVNLAYNSLMDLVFDPCLFMYVNYVNLRHLESTIITYQAYAAYSKEQLNKNRIFTAKRPEVYFYSGKI